MASKKHEHEYIHIYNTVFSDILDGIKEKKKTYAF